MSALLRRAAIGLALGPLVLGAQTRPVLNPAAGAPVPLSRSRGVIDGIVSDTNLSPLRAAFVSLVGTTVRVGTGPNGRFRITDIPTGQYLVIVKHVGYRPTSGVVDVAPNDTARLSYTLAEAGPTVLQPVVVSKVGVSTRVAGFEERRKLGFGEFMDAADIARKNTVFSTELLRNFTTIDVSQNRNQPVIEYYAMSRREAGSVSVGYCPMQVYLDQVPMPTPFNLDLLPPPRDLAGIEVYAGSSTIPPQFSGFNRGCGVIMVWTKDGAT